MAKEIQVAIRVRCDSDRCDADRMWHGEGQEDRTKGVGPVLGTTGHGQEFNRG